MSTYILYMYYIMLGKYCPLLTKPKNGDYSCSGLQITGTTCRFWCNFGYKRVGPKRLKCMTTSMWSGNISSCEILQCDPLENPENGSVILPCGTKVNTNCSILCSPGFYTTSVAPFQRCEPTEYNNATQWSKPPNCTGKLVIMVINELGHKLYYGGLIKNLIALYCMYRIGN